MTIMSGASEHLKPKRVTGRVNLRMGKPVSKDLAEVVRLKNQLRKTKKASNAATRDSGEKTEPQSPEGH